ncbi:hypothetical protein IWW48_001360 [Coemansia sp. RSA 1200]|nr:hypothetical protein IWW48_001360 [Coemansia sp. RSA 1200]
MLNEEDPFRLLGGLQQTVTNDIEAAHASENTQMAADGRAQQVPENTDSIQDSSMSERMLELDNLISTIKLSLDSHASSYYSVASQIAELNAHIGSLELQEKHIEIGSHTIQDGCGQDNGSCHDPATNIADACFDFSANAVFSTDVSESTASAATITTTTIAEDADGGHTLMPEDQSDQENSDEHYTRIQQMIASLIKDADSALQSNPAINRFSICSDDFVDIPGKFLAFTEQLSSASAEFGETPTFVSDAEPGVQDSAYAYAKQSSSRFLSGPERHPLTPRQKQPHDWEYSSLPKYMAVVDPSEADAESDSEVSPSSVLGTRYRRKSHNARNRSQRRHKSRSRRYDVSSYHGDRAMADNRTSRYKSYTAESIRSNSSETCVSLVSRAAKVFHRTPRPCVHTALPCYEHNYLPPTSMDKSSHMLNRDTLDVPEDQFSGKEQSAFFTPNTSMNTHEFPRLSSDDCNYEDTNDICSASTERRPSSLSICPVSPFINRFRNTVTRVALRSASFVDKSVNDDIEAYECSGGVHENIPLQERRQPRMRSYTHGGLTGTSDSGCGLTSIGYPNSDNEQRRHSVDLIREIPQLSPTAATRYVVGKFHENSSGNVAGIVSIFSLMYWTLLFTLGALMLDSFLCQVAGKRVMGTVDRIVQTDKDTCQLEYSGGRRGRRGSGSSHGSRENMNGNNEDGTNVAGAVGRLMCWYVEDPEDASNTSMLRLQRVQAARGSFKHIE